ncbi:MAG: GAF domain-containing protein [Elusimicrobia bacterium]|nr:GAF domain-containing protein [Elusimicrobiota bacterium]
MNKTIIKHISIIISVAVLIVFIWVLFVYVFFDSELKKSIYPKIEDSKQILSEIVTKNFAVDKTKKFISEFEKNEYIRYLTIRKKQDDKESVKIKSSILSILKLSYPIKNENIVVGWIEVWPSYELFSKILSNGINITIFFVSIILLLIIFIFVCYLYVKKYVFDPFKQIKIMINNIISNKEVNIDESNEYGIWKDVFYDLKKLHNKVFDINTTMNLLFSATTIVGSDLELVNSIHVVFNVVQKRIKDSHCALFIPDESGQLKVFAKNGLLNNEIDFIAQDSNNYIWNTYEEVKEIIVNDKTKITKEKLGGLYDDKIGSLISIPLIDEDRKCIGSFIVISKTENSFNKDNVDIINSVSKYLVALIKRIKDYQKIKETNRKLEIEIETASKEIIKTNDILVKQIKNIRDIFDIAFYVSTKTNLSESVEYIASKAKEILDIERFGIFTYNKEQNMLCSVKGSFDSKDNLKIVNKKGTIYNDIINNCNNFILNRDSDLNNYSKNLLSDMFNLKTAAFVPVKQDNTVFAIIVAINKKDSSFNCSDIKILEHISVIIYGIIEKMSLYDKIKGNIKMGETNGNS